MSPLSRVTHPQLLGEKSDKQQLERQSHSPVLYTLKQIESMLQQFQPSIDSRGVRSYQIYMTDIDWPGSEYSEVSYTPAMMYYYAAVDVRS